MTRRPETLSTIKADTRARRRALYEDALAILDGEYASGLQVEQVARRVASSRRQLQRAFAGAGTSFAAELRRRRLDRAAELLASTHVPVRDLAGAVGYRQPSQFAKAFRRHTGRAPTEFRSAAQAAAELARAA